MTWWANRNLHPKTKSKFVVVFGTQMFLPNVKSITKPKIEFETKEYKLLNHKFNYPGNGTWQPVDIKFVDMNGLADNLKTFDTSAFLWQIMNNTGYAYPYMDPSSKISLNPYYKNVNKEGTVIGGKGHHIATKISSGFRTITTPEKSSTIANSFGDGLSGEIDNNSAATLRQKVSIFQISPEHPEDNGGEDKPDGMQDGIISEAWHLVNPIVKKIDWGDLAYDSDELIEYSMTVVYDWAIFDRESIGKRLSTVGYDPKQYNSFSGMWAAAGEEIKRQQIVNSEAFKEVKSAFDLKAASEVDIVEIDGEKFLDVNGDGEITDEEKFLSTPDNVQSVEDAKRIQLEELDRANKEAIDRYNRLQDQKEKDDMFKGIQESKKAGTELTDKQRQFLVEQGASMKNEDGTISEKGQELIDEGLYQQNNINFDVDEEFGEELWSQDIQDEIDEEDKNRRLEEEAYQLLQEIRDNPEGDAFDEIQNSNPDQQDT